MDKFVTTSKPKRKRSSLGGADVAGHRNGSQPMKKRGPSVYESLQRLREILGSGVSEGELDKLLRRAGYNTDRAAELFFTRVEDGGNAHGGAASSPAPAPAAAPAADASSAPSAWTCSVCTFA